MARKKASTKKKVTPLILTRFERARLIVQSTATFNGSQTPD